MNSTGEFVIENGILLKYNGESKEVVIPQGVTKIGKDAFWCCENIKSINIPKSVTEIGDSAFAGCKNLMTITIPKGVTEINNKTFYGCNCLTSITIPEGVTKIGEYAFVGTKFSNIVIPESVIEIGRGAFASCENLASIAIPMGVMKIGDSAFFSCKNLTDITIPESVSQIGAAAFDLCTKLSNITIPRGLTKINDAVFRGCDALTNIIIPMGVTKIGSSAFACCMSLTSITIPESVTEIGKYAFGLCNSLTSIVIPKSVTKIDDDVFARCQNLKSITIPDTVTEIGSYTFVSCASLINVTIPEGVMKIGDFAFECCENLTDITIPRSIKVIGNDVFNGSCKVVICTPKGSYAEQYAKEHNINLKISGSLGSDDVSGVEFHTDTLIRDVSDTSSTSYTEYSYGNVYFKLPTGVFEYHGISNCDEAQYYGKKHPEHICCDVIISTCDARPMTQYIIYEKCIKDSPVFSTIVRQNKLVVNKGKGSVIETIVNDRTITLWVRAGVCNYFRLTVGQSYDRNVTVSELRDFAYKILDTVTIDDDVKDFKRPATRKEVVEKKVLSEQPREENNNTEKQEGCYIATAIYGDYNDPNVMVLRRFRDNYLSERNWGIKFIELYYRYSPRLADKLKNHIVINAIIRKILDMLVKKLWKNQ